MLRSVILLQLTLWVASIHAFYPFIPQWPCDKGGICEDGKKSGSSKARDTVTYKLSQRARPDGYDTAARAVHEANRLRHKHRPPLRTHFAEVTRRENKFSIVPPVGPTTGTSAGLYQDGSDISYFVQMEIGSPPQPLYMLFDTGAGTTWVQGQGCGSKACEIHNSFKPGDSKTFTNTDTDFQIKYGTGDVEGKLGKDTFTVAGLTVDMTFGVANWTSDDFLYFPFDGILALSMFKGAQDSDNFLKVLKDSKVLKSNIFALTLSRSQDGPNTGEVTFGGTDASKYTGEVSYQTIPEKAQGDWALTLGDFTYDGKTAGVKKDQLAYIDSGTSYMFGPPEDVAALHKLIPGANNTADKEIYIVPCDTNKVLTVSFGGIPYTISPKDWVLRRSVSDQVVCSSNIFAIDVVGDNSWLLGDALLKNVYSVFDADASKIGFATRPDPDPAVLSAASASAAAASSAKATSPTAIASSNGGSSSALTTVDPTVGSPTGLPFVPGRTGRETSITADAPASQTAGTSSSPAPSSTGTASSPADQLTGNKLATFIFCISAAFAALL